MDDMEYPKHFEGGDSDMGQREIQPEIKDLIEMLNRFLAVNKTKKGQKVVAVGTLAVFDEDDNLDKEKNVIFAVGNIEDLRVVLNDLRDRIEDNVDQNDMVDL